MRKCHGIGTVTVRRIIESVVKVWRCMELVAIATFLKLNNKKVSDALKGLDDVY